MKKNALKAILAFALSVCFIVCTVSCNGTEDTKRTAEKTNVSATTEENPESGKETGSKLPVGVVPTSQSNLSYYLKLNGIEGESKNSKHDKWIEVIDFSVSVACERQDGLPSPNEMGKVDRIVFTHLADKATPVLQKTCMVGSVVKSGEFNAVKTVSGKENLLYKVTFSNLRVLDSSVTTEVAENGSIYLVERVVMTAESEESSYTKGIESANSTGCYLKIDGINGGHQSGGHYAWIDITGFSHGSKCEDYIYSSSYEPVVFTHSVDEATPELHKRCIDGVNIKSAEFHVARSVAGKETVTYKVALNEFRIVKAEVRTVTDENGASYLIEEVTLLVNKETWTSVPVGMSGEAGGATEAEYDQGKKV